MPPQVRPGSGWPRRSSSGLPRRPSGCRAVICWRAATGSGWSAMIRPTHGESTVPGATALHRIPRRMKSTAMERVNATTAPLDAVYAARRSTAADRDRGRHVHDDPPTLREHERDHRLTAVEHAHDVDRERPLQVGRVRLEEIARDTDGGVVHQHVHAAEALHCRGDHTLHLRAVTHVDSDGKCLSACTHELVRGRRRGSGIELRDDHPIPDVGKRLRGRPTDARAGACDDDHPGSAGQGPCAVGARNRLRAGHHREAWSSPRCGSRG